MIKKLLRKAIGVLILGFTLIPMSASAIGVELITNGGFETGDLSDWSCSVSGRQLCLVYNNVHSGSFAMTGIENLNVGTLSQSISTVVGQSYNLSFWSNVSSPTFPGMNLNYAVTGGAQIAVLNSFMYTETTDSFIATAGLTTLSLFFETAIGRGYWSIDDISVMRDDTSVMSSDVSPPSAVPVPAAIWLFGTGILGLIGIGKRKKAA